MLPRPRALRSLLVTAVAAISGGLFLTTPANAYADDPIDAAKALAAPGLPGANVWSCKPSAARPRPVVLVHGTFANGTVNWLTDAPILASRGYCVYTSQALNGAHNVTLQNLCAFDISVHAAIAFDPIALHETENALDPAHASKSNCLSHG